MRVTIIVTIFLLASPVLADESVGTFIIQENPPTYWYCKIGAPNCFWHSLFHDRYNCKEFKPYHGKPCDLNDVPIEVVDRCKDFPFDIDVGYCYERFWAKEKEDSLPLGK